MAKFWDFKIDSQWKCRSTVTTNDDTFKNCRLRQEHFNINISLITLNLGLFQFVFSMYHQMLNPLQLNLSCAAFWLRSQIIKYLSKSIADFCPFLQLYRNWRHLLNVILIDLSKRTLFHISCLRCSLINWGFYILCWFKIYRKGQFCRYYSSKKWRRSIDLQMSPYFRFSAEAAYSYKYCTQNAYV